MSRRLFVDGSTVETLGAIKVESFTLELAMASLPEFVRESSMIKQQCKGNGAERQAIKAKQNRSFMGH